MTVLDPANHDEMSRADAELAECQAILEAAAAQGAIDLEMGARLRATQQDMARHLNAQLTMRLDPSLVDEAKTRLINLLSMRIDDGELLDIADAMLIECEALRHILRDLASDSPPVNQRNSGEVVAQIDEWLPGLTVARRAELLGLSERSLQRRRASPGMPSSSRMATVLRLVAILKHAWTDEGVYAWFHRTREALGGTAPIDLLEDRSREGDLLELARSGRVQAAV